ncbi:MAG: signal peptidase [Planctomycetaceae bacterium]|nr:signal peptidase [Planctomycetaceae bacterium]
MSHHYVVRYGVMRHLADFASKAGNDYRRGEQVIVRSHRGTEWGEVLCASTERTREYLGAKDTVGRILRTATPEDERSRDEALQKEPGVFTDGNRVIAEHKLAMQLIDVELIFGGERLVFYYLSEQRIDFRNLVKDLAKEFKTRIEMRQIGIRDEAKLLADYGDCGKPVCCNTHLQEMPPVSMKMAKLQKATLDPQKISGRCGRLKCCLRYEYDTYDEYRRELPKVGRFVVTREGKGKVLALEILARKVLVGFEDNRRAMVDEKDILTVISGGSKPEAKGTPSSEDE